MILVVFIVVLVRSSLSNQSKDLMAVYLRIMMNHIQLFSLISSFDMHWPVNALSFFSSIKSVSQVSTQFLSVDCFLDTRSGNPVSNNYSFGSPYYYEKLANYLPNEIPDTLATDSSLGVTVYFKKLLILALAPFVVSICSSIGWAIIFKVSNYLENKEPTVEI